MNQIGFKAVRVQDCPKETAINVLNEKLSPQNITTKDVSDTFVFSQNGNSVDIEVNKERPTICDQFPKDWEPARKGKVLASMDIYLLDLGVQALFKKTGYNAEVIKDKQASLLNKEEVRWALAYHNKMK